MNDKFTVTVLNKEGFSQSYTFHAEKPADIPISICYDDTIKIIKYKILHGLYSKDLDDISYEELYLYAVVEIPFDLLHWYKQITKNDTILLSAQTFCQLLTNLAEIGNNDEELEKILKSHEMEVRLKNNDTFDYELIASFSWFQNRKSMKIKIPLGNRIMVLLSNKQKKLIPIDFLFPTNPFDLLTDTKMEKWKKNKEIIHMDDELLFHYGHEILDNNIFVILAKDLIKDEIDYKLFTSLYYPYLQRKNIFTKQALQEKTEELREASNKIVNNLSVQEEFHNMDIYYDVCENITDKMIYVQNGIDSFSFTLENDSFQTKMNIPLESIFQNIHSSESVPYIEYHVGKKQDPMLRLFGTEISKDGKKIPYLSSSVLESLMKKKTGNNPHITLFVNNGLGNTSKDFIEIILEQNGNIFISGKLVVPMIPQTFEPWLKGVTNPVFLSINEYLQQSGYSIAGFQSLLDPFLRINVLSYICVFKLSKKLLLENHLGCLSSLFSVEPDETKRNGNGYYYRYKRVEYFKMMDDEEQFISQLLKNKGIKRDHSLITKQLQIRYPHYSLIEIQHMMNAYATKYKTTNGRFINRKTETMANGGFPISFEQNQLGSTCTIRVSQIDMMPYLFLIPIYLESILQLCQKAVPEKWKSKWLSTLNKETHVIPDIIPIEISEENNQSPIFAPNKDSDDDEDSNEINYLNLLEESDDENEEDDKQVEDDKKAVDEDEDDKDKDEDDDENGNQNQKENEDEAGQEEEEEEDSDVGEEDIARNKNKNKKEEDEDIDYSFAGGGKHKQDKPAHYFINRIKERDPKLYETMDGYENICEINQKRQPIVLTKKEKEDMDKKYSKNSKPYTEALEYGKDEHGDPYYYICPRFWCTKPGSEGVLTEEDAKSGVCGNIIKNLKNPKEGEFVYDRTHDLYKAYVPGFVKDKCYPCCFKSWDKPEQKRLRNQCNPTVYTDGPKNINKKNQVLVNEQNPFILDFTQREGLDHGRFALIPIPIQLFLGIDTKKCIEDHYVKDKCPVFLRYGVEGTPQNLQSFFACMGDLYSYQHNLRPPMELEQFRETFIDQLSLDLFVKLQNGGLVSRFQSRDLTNVDIYKYKDNGLYKNIDLQNESQLDFLKYSIKSYENFLLYLRDDSVKIDHTFLWDIVTKPNPKLFPVGLNLVILEMLDHDVTNKVRLVCPTHHYQQPLYDETRHIAIIIKNDDRYELICKYERKKTKTGHEVTVSKIYAQNDKTVKELYSILKAIKYMVNKQCSPYSSKSSSYKFKTNLHCEIVYDMLEQIKLDVSHKVLNYQGKVIALMVDFKKKQYYLPCLPSTSIGMENIPTKWIDDDMWNNYDQTISFLNFIYDKSDKKLPCKPVFRIVEDGLVVGILTASNQFIVIDPPIQNINGDPIPVMNSSNYVVADRILSKIETNEQNIEDKTIQYIYLENEFFNAFRTTLRILMALFSNRKTLKKMNNICVVTDWMYSKKKKEIIKLLQKIGQEYVLFQQYEKKVLLNLHHVFACKTNDTKKQYCLAVETDGKTRGVLLLPSKHLLTNDNNIDVYYGRLADELIRHRRVQLFMFYPDQYLNIGSQEYNVMDNEFIIPKSLLTTDYLKMKKHEYGKYAQSIPYDYAEPENSAPRREPLDLINQMEEERRVK